MRIATDAELDCTSLVREGAVHSAIFTDESIFEAELERIFYRYWVYAAHESEIPQLGDYCTRWIGRQQIVVARGHDGQIRAFFNRCRHRGTMICNRANGNAQFFRCPYHGWTYNDRGALVGVTYPSRYGPEFKKEELGLTPVPRIDQYRGLIFVSLSDEGPTLQERLGRAVPYIDLFLGGSPTQKVELRGGRSKLLFKGNWKFVGQDGYHTNFVHKTMFDLIERKRGPGYARGVRNSDKSPNQTWDLGGGHSRLYNSPIDKMVKVGATTESPNAGDIPDTEGGRRYMASMAERYGGEAEAEDIIRGSRDVHMCIWPNLHLNGVELRTVRPLSAGTTEIIGYPVLLADVPEEINEQRIRTYDWVVSPSGVAFSDDTEIFERNQIGLQCDEDPWLLLTRGIALQEETSDGRLVGNITDEVTQRAQMREWAKAMGNGGVY